MTDDLATSDELVKAIATDLSICRQRGIELLDRNLGNQEPVKIEKLEELADSYAQIQALQLDGRVARIKRLLRDALAEYRQRGHADDAELVADLFFGGHQDKVTSSGSELLDAAAKKRGIGPASRNRFKATYTATIASFASFLIKIVNGLPESTAPEPPSTPHPRRQMSTLRRVALGVTGGVAAIAFGTMVVILLHTSGQTNGTADGPSNRVNSANNTSTLVTTTTSQSAVYIGRTFAEQEGHLGSMVVSNPSNLSEIGRIQPLQVLQVSCKVLNPSMGSVYPDGYWYRLASSPWNNQAYAIANTFLNGDPIVGTSNGPQHNTDFSVPDCPTP